MSNQDIIANLREILADLYQDERSMRRVVDDAGLKTAYISFSSAAIEVWYDIWIHATHTGKIDALLKVVLKDYGDNRKLQEACDAYQNALQEVSSAPVKAKSPVSTIPDTRSERLYIGAIVIMTILIATTYVPGLWSSTLRIISSVSKPIQTVSIVMPNSLFTTASISAPTTITSAIGGALIGFDDNKRWAEPKQIYYLRYRVNDPNRNVKVTLTLADLSKHLRVKDDINIYLVTSEQKDECQGVKPLYSDGCNVIVGNNEINSEVVQLDFAPQSAEGFLIAIYNKSAQLAYYQLSIENGSFELY